MKIVSIVSNNKTYQPIVYDNLISKTVKDFECIIIVPFTNKVMTPSKMIIFLFNLFGIKGFILKFIEVVMCNILSFFENYLSLSRSYSLSNIAKKYNIPIYYFNSLGNSDLIKLLKSINPDLIISSQGHYVSKQILKIPKYGVINKHAGLLPEYRGAYPVFWAMLNGEKKIGVSIHFMNDKIDGGDIIIQEEIQIFESDTFETLYSKVIKLTPELFVKAIKLIKNNEMTIIKNEEEHSTYFSFPKKEDILRFKKRGLKII
jgi:folate-dependent phosphoribosylglycinamide formyltransferase PurN